MQKLTLCLLAVCQLFISLLHLEASSSSIIQPPYLKWDNETPATTEDLIVDPLLILRKIPSGADRRSLHLDWEKVAQLDFMPEGEGCCVDDYLLIKDQPALTPEDFKSGLSCSLKVISEKNFDHAKPRFDIYNQKYSFEKIQWQIASDQDFTSILIDSTQEFVPNIALTDLDETFLNRDHRYFFRAKGCTTEGWENWSYPVSFTVVKPEPVRNVSIEKNSDNHFSLEWEEGNNYLETSYLIFGSNSLDFIPSIYHTIQADAICDGVLAKASTSNNFLGETKNTRWLIDENYAYYRIIAKSQGQLSTPSPLIYFYQGSSCPTRDVLQHDKTQPDAFHALRTPLHDAYPWMQAKSLSSNDTVAYRYVKNPYVTEEVWEELQSYFLPENHPIKAALDNIFSKRRVLESDASMEKVGFKIINHSQSSMVTAKHSAMKGYLVKAFLDPKETTDWIWWKKRIDGARCIQSSIDRHNFNNLFKVPKKWIYPIPPQPAPKNTQWITPKNFILVVEDMQILDSRKNHRAFKKQMTKPLLDALYVELTENRLIDSIYADNIPFCKDGKIAFIDTEHVNDYTQPVKLWLIARYLSDEMHAYWDQVIQNGVP